MFYTIGDVHLGKRFKSKDIPLDKRGIREQILRLRFEQVIARAIKQVQKGDYEGIVFMGDLFDSFCVSYEDILIAYNGLKKIPITTPVVILEGNHDQSKNTDRVSAFQILEVLCRDIWNRFFVTNKRDWYYINNSLFVPYLGKGVNSIITSPDKTIDIYGHFEEEDFPWLRNNFAHVYSGHIHSPRQEGNLTVVGSIMPYTFAEDPTNTFMKTCTLAEYEADVAAGTSSSRCYRLKLQAGEEMPDSATANCLQLSRYSSEKAVEQEDLSVNFESFDLEKLMHEALDTLGVFQEFYDLYTKYRLEESNV